MLISIYLLFNYVHSYCIKTKDMVLETENMWMVANIQIFIIKVTFSAELQQNTKLLVLQYFKQHSMYHALRYFIIILFNYIHMFTIIYNYTAIEVNGEHIINGDLTIVRSGHYSADGDDYDYYRASTEVETVSSTSTLVNPVTLQVCNPHNNIDAL